MSMSSFLATIRLHGQYPFNVKIDALNTSMATSIAEATYGKGSIFLMQGYDLTSEGLSDIASRSKSSLAGSSSSVSNSVSSITSSVSSSTSNREWVPQGSIFTGITIIPFTIIGMIYGVFADAHHGGGFISDMIVGGLVGAAASFFVPVLLVALIVIILKFVYLHLGGIIGTIVVSTILIAMALDFYNDWIKNKRKDDQYRNLLIKAYVHTLGYADDKIWFKVATFTLHQKKITNDILKKKFRLNDKYVHALVNLMADEGMIGEANAKGERLVLKKFEVSDKYFIII